MSIKACVSLSTSSFVLAELSAKANCESASISATSALSFTLKLSSINCVFCAIKALVDLFKSLSKSPIMPSLNALCRILPFPVSSTIPFSSFLISTYVPNAPISPSWPLGSKLVIKSINSCGALRAESCCSSPSNTFISFPPPRTLRSSFRPP